MLFPLLSVASENGNQKKLQKNERLKLKTIRSRPLPSTNSNTFLTPRIPLDTKPPTVICHQKTMSEPIPESIPTSQDPRSKRPTKRLALTPTSAQAQSLASLFSHPEREIIIPPTSAPPSSANFLKPPEIVANVQGSSAGAGSGEFHVYKASRRREYERIRIMEGEVERENADQEFERRKEERNKLDEARTEKRRKKRDARKKGKGGGEKGGNGVSGGGLMDVDGGENGEGDDQEVREGKLGPIVDIGRGVVIHDDYDDDDGDVGKRK